MKDTPKYSPRTVLVFLGMCLAFAESSLGIIVTLADANAIVVATFALLGLFGVLGTLTFMYRLNPGFLTLAGEQASDLAILQTLAKSNPGVITSDFVLSLTQGVITEKTKVDTGALRLGEEAERLDEESKKL